MPVTELFYITPFFWLILLLTTPVITMRLFALEKFSGTFETLMTTPVSDFQVVAGQVHRGAAVLRRDVAAAAGLPAGGAALHQRYGRAGCAA